MFALGLVLSALIGVSLGFFGGGGSILTVPLLVYGFGLDAKSAIASSLLVVGAASVFGVIQHARAGHLAVRTGLLFGGAGMTGSYLGGRAAAYVDGTLLLLLFASLMALTAAAMWRGRQSSVASAPARHARVRLLAQGFGVGIFTGLVGAGGGFLIVPALTLWAGLPMPVAVGTSLWIIVMQSLAGYAGYAAHVRVDFALVGAVATAAVAGSFVGSWLSRRVDPVSLRRGFAGFVGVMAAVILVREVDVWIGTAQEALPSSVPQLVFVLLVLGIGVATGRSTRAARREPLADRIFTDGAGI